MFLGERYQRGTVLIDNKAHSSTESLNLGVSVVDHRAQRWDVELFVRPSPEFVRKLSAHRGRELWSSFTIPCPQYDGTGPDDGYLYHYPAATRLNLSAQATSGTGAVSVVKGSIADVTLRTGRFVSFAGHTKIYQVTTADDLEFDDNTTVRSVTITPLLTANVAVGSYIRLNPNITVRHTPGNQWAYTGAWLYQDTIYLQEVI